MLTCVYTCGAVLVVDKSGLRLLYIHTFTSLKCRKIELRCLLGTRENSYLQIHYNNMIMYNKIQKLRLMDIYVQ